MSLLRGLRRRERVTAPPRVDDVARFATGDPAALVAASLCCARCLGTARAVALARSAHGGVARCRCGGCGALTSVGLDEEQFVRLVLAPPPGPAVSVDA